MNPIIVPADAAQALGVLDGAMLRY